MDLNKAPYGFPHTRKESPLKDDQSLYCTFPDPLCKLNLKETSDFVKAFPMSRGLVQGSAQRREVVMSGSLGHRRSLEEAPSTPGRPVFSFSGGRKSFPSKWDDAEKWLISSSCHESSSPHATRSSAPEAIFSNQILDFHQKGEPFAEKQRVAEEKMISRSAAETVPAAPSLLGPRFSFYHGVPSEVLLKDKFTDNVELAFANSGYSELSKEAFMSKNAFCGTLKDAGIEVAAEVQRRDVGTGMTPLGSSKTSRCHSPIKNSSPARHNTPADRSGPLVASSPGIDLSELKDCHFAKLQLSAQYDATVSNWSSREEEEEEISKSLRHCEISGGRKSIAESRALAWEDEEKTKSCIRYQREEAKIQAWVNLQTAKAEAQSRKLEVKIQKMRSNLEEKLMKRMTIVQRKAEEWRAAAQLQHSQQIVRASQQAQKMRSSQHRCSLPDDTSCGCFPCNGCDL